MCTSITSYYQTCSNSNMDSFGLNVGVGNDNGPKMVDDVSTSKACDADLDYWGHSHENENDDDVAVDPLTLDDPFIFALRRNQHILNPTNNKPSTRSEGSMKKLLKSSKGGMKRVMKSAVSQVSSVTSVSRNGSSYTIDELQQTRVADTAWGNEVRTSSSLPSSTSKGPMNNLLEKVLLGKKKVHVM